MSKKVLKSRFLSTRQEKPLSVVEPLQFKSFSCPPSEELDRPSVISPNSRFTHDELGSEKPQWEYKPLVPTNLSAVKHPRDKAPRPNGTQPSYQPRKKAPLAYFSSSMSSSLHPILQLEKKNSFLCDSSDSNTSDSQTWSLNSTSSSSFDPKSDHRVLNFKHYSNGSPPVNLPSFSSCESQNNLSNQHGYEQIPNPSVFPSANCAPSPCTSTVKSIEDSESPSDTISKKNYELNSSKIKHKSNESQRDSNPPVHRKRKEDNLLPKGCKFSKSEIVDTPIDTFNKLLEKLPKDEQMVFKDSRRKGKNRGAARRARDRRIRQHDDLLMQKKAVSKELISKEEELKELVAEHKMWAELADIIQRRVNHLKAKL